MNQNTQEIILRDLMDRDDGWGCDEGRLVHDRLLECVESKASADLWAISLKGVTRTDASFPRESVIRLAQRFRSQKGFCVRHLKSRDLLDNWDAGAKKLEQPLMIWAEWGPELIGPALNEGIRPAFELLVQSGSLTTAELAHKLDLNTSNASNKLKAMWQQGYILRRERTATTGGIEHEYFVVR